MRVCFVCSALEGSLRNGESQPPHYSSRLNCSSCGTPASQHSEVCPKTSRSHLAEEMTELHSEYSDSSCGESVVSAQSSDRLGAWPWTAPKSMQIHFSGTENGAFFCNECDSKFAEEEALKQHMLQVHSDKPYKCDRCQAAFRYKGNLASHKTVHTGTSKGSGRYPFAFLFACSGTFQCFLLRLSLCF